jgi:MoxR-like ATPase
VPLLTAEVMRRIAADPRRRRQLLRVLNHDVPPGRLVTAPLAVRALAGGLLRHPGRRTQLLREARTAVADEVRHLRMPTVA